MRKDVTLSKRLAAAAAWVPAGAHLCDVGTDHAALPIWLVQQGRIASALATDIRQGPLLRARRNVERYGCTGAIRLRLCDGLSAISPEEADAVTICGMGGKMIVSILEAAPWTRQGTALILQPMKSQGDLRRWLSAHSYRIQRERVLWEEGHWYTLLQAAGGSSRDTWTPGTLEAGHPAHWCRGDDRLGYLQYMEQRLTRQKTGLEQSAGGGSERLAYLNAALAEFAAWRGQLERGVWPT